MRCSVVMPNFNKGSRLYESFKSWADQTVPKEDFELIIVDDHSTDSYDKEFLRDLYNLSWVRVIRLPENKGPAYARHIGETESQTDIILRADSDDLALPNRVLHTLETFDQHPETTFFHADEFNHTEAGKVLMSPGPFSYVDFFETGHFFFANGTVAYRKSIHQQPHETDISSDEWMFYYEVLKNPAHRLRYLPEPIATYRTTESNLQADMDSADKLWQKRKKYVQELAKEYHNACS